MKSIRINPTIATCTIETRRTTGMLSTNYRESFKCKIFEESMLRVLVFDKLRKMESSNRLESSATFFIEFQLTVGTVNVISVLTYNQKKRIFYESL